MALPLFWLSVGAIVHATVGLPLLLMALAKLRPRPHQEAEITPQISMLIAAYNEEVDLPPKLRNVLAADYPRGALEVIVASDGSDDRTVEAAASIDDERLVVLDLPRTGKAGALNSALEHARGDIVVFTDANSMLVPDGLRQLVRHFADPEVGGVAGNQVYTDAEEVDVEGERAHWAVDRAVKQAASALGSVVSATGALYAVRRELVPEVIDGVTDDFYVSTNVVAAGKRLVFAPDAIVHEPVTANVHEEYARKERVMMRGFRSVLARRTLLDPRRHGIYALQLFSYKVLRRLLAIPVAVLGISSIALWRRGWLYRIVGASQVAFWGAAAVGHVCRDAPVGRRRILAIPSFVATNMMLAVRAATRVARGAEVRQWTPVRSGPSS